MQKKFRNTEGKSNEFTQGLICRGLRTFTNAVNCGPSAELWAYGVSGFDTCSDLK